MTATKLPTYDQFIEPLLRVLAEHPEGMRTQEAYEQVSLRVGLTPEDRLVILPSGRQPTYQNRIGWAHDALKRARLSRSARRGYWCLTPAGAEFAAKYPALSAEQVRELATAYDHRPANPSVEEAVAPAHAPVAKDPTASPDDRLNGALEEIRTSIANELLELIQHNTPEFFEQLVLDLLHAMGYGNSRSDLQRVGRSGDGGIDGVIPLDPLGLEKVCLQAKRWQGSVGRPTIQAFYGALAGQRAKKGVIITTSHFTKDAIDFAASVEGIVLIDGEQLTELMMDHGVGTSHTRVIRVPEIDSDYFEA